MKNKIMLLLPVIVALIIALIPAPAGMESYTWYFFAIFVGSIVGLILEPLPGAVIGLIAVLVISTFSPWLLFSAHQLASPKFNATNEAFNWAVSGFSNSTVWLIFSAFMFALGYEKTGLGRRISLMLVKKLGKRTLTLGYAIALADLILAPFTPSNTARSGGTIYPVIRNLPPLYDSKPHDESSRRIGSYLMWVSISATCVSSTLFLTALAPNLLASALVTELTGLTISWMDWFIAMLPVGIVLWLLTPVMAYYLYPPEIKSNNQVPVWAAGELQKQGSLSLHEKLLIIFVMLALILWIGFGSVIEPAISALIVIALMLITGVISWADVTSNKAAWNTFFWFATLVALASGLSSVGFVHWLGVRISSDLVGFSLLATITVLLIAFFVLHYFFASGTAHATALVPVMIAIVAGMHGMNVYAFAILLCGTQGIMGIITPYANGPAPIYYGSGYLPAKDYWRMGTIFGVIYFLLYLVIEISWIGYLFGFTK